MNPHSSVAIVAACLVALVAASSVNATPFFDFTPSNVLTDSSDDVVHAYAKAGLISAPGSNALQKFNVNLMSKVKPAPKYDAVDVEGNLTPGNSEGITSFSPKSGVSTTDIHQVSLSGAVDLSKGVRTTDGTVLPSGTTFTLKQGDKSTELTLDQAGRLSPAKDQVYLPRGGDILTAKTPDGVGHDLPLPANLVEGGPPGAAIRLGSVADETDFHLGAYAFPADKGPYTVQVTGGANVNAVVRDGEFINVNTMQPIKSEDVLGVKHQPDNVWVDATKFKPAFPPSGWFMQFWEKFAGRYLVRGDDGKFTGIPQWKKPTDPIPATPIRVVNSDGSTYTLDPTKGAPDGGASTTNNAVSKLEAPQDNSVGASVTPPKLPKRVSFDEANLVSIIPSS